MENKLIGCKEIFAIEYLPLESSSYVPYGGCRIWFCGGFIGDLDYGVFLVGTCRSLEGMLTVDVESEDIPPLPNTAIEFSDLMDGSEVESIGGNYFLAIDGYDDFLKLFFRKENSILIYYCLHPMVEDREEYSSYQKEPKSAEIDLSYFDEVVKRFRQDIDMLTEQMSRSTG